MWTKLQILNKSFSVIGAASYLYDLLPEEYEDALGFMDGMMAAYDGVGLRLGYNLPSSQSESSLNDDSGLPDTAVLFVCYEIGCLLGPTYGKPIPADVMKIRNQLRKMIFARYSLNPQMQLPVTLPRGAGNRWQSIWRPFVSDATYQDIVIDHEGVLDS